MNTNNCLVDVNLDAMDLDDLRQAHSDLAELQDYLKYKIAAVMNRKEGKIDRAIHYETRCDVIYNNLPDSVKSW